MLSEVKGADAVELAYRRGQDITVWQKWRTMIGQRKECDHLPSSRQLRGEYVAFCISSQMTDN